MAGYMMMKRSMAHELISAHIQDFIYSSLRSLFHRSSSTTLTLTIDDYIMGMSNEIYRAAQTYLSTKISHDAVRLRISKGRKTKTSTCFSATEKSVNDVFQDVELKWTFVRRGKRRRWREEKHKDLILSSYIPHVETRAKEIRDERMILMLPSLNSLRWELVILHHPSSWRV